MLTLLSSTRDCRLGGVSRNLLIGAGGLRNILICADVLSSILVEFLCVPQRYSTSGCLPFILAGCQLCLSKLPLAQK